MSCHHCRFTYSLGYYTLIGVLHFPLRVQQLLSVWFVFNLHICMWHNCCILRCLLKHVGIVAVLLLCVCFWLNSPLRNSSSLSSRKGKIQNYMHNNPFVWSKSLRLFGVLLPGPSWPTSYPPCWEAICLHVRAEAKENITDNFCQNNLTWTKTQFKMS